jgi:plasmid stabilization system protein ParE
MEQAVAWWHDNRPAAPGAVEDELERAFDLLSTKPGIGAVARNVALPGIRRVHLSRIHYHLYYRVAADWIEILALWHTSRGSNPPV